MSDSKPIVMNLTFRDLQWKTRWLVVGGAFLAVCFSLRFINRDWVSGWSILLWLVVTGLIPQILMLVFPLLTHESTGAERLRPPRLRRWLIELAVAIPIVLVITALLSLLNYFLWGFSRGKTFTPDAIDNLARTWNPRYVYLLAIFSVAFAPFAEEIFFRGFIYNAFRWRMPILAAGIIQSLIFGFSHHFGTTHAILACILGMAITAVYEWRKTLVTPILVHAGINFVSAIGTIALMNYYAESPLLGVIGGNDDQRCTVTEIVPDSAAAEAGIIVGDVITEFDGEPVVNFTNLRSLILTRQPNDVVTLKIVREDETHEIDVTLKRRGYSKQP
jgi:membrane protease YdiL (CAAX protease family)